jgi:hypothetical protein
LCNEVYIGENAKCPLWVTSRRYHATVIRFDVSLRMDPNKVLVRQLLEPQDVEYLNDTGIADALARQVMRRPG